MGREDFACVQHASPVLRLHTPADRTRFPPTPVTGASPHRHWRKLVGAARVEPAALGLEGLRLLPGSLTHSVFRLLRNVKRSLSLSGSTVVRASGMRA